MKTQTVSLLAFHNKVKELAEKAGKKSFSASAEILTFNNNMPVLNFRCWVNDYGAFVALTPTEALTKLRNAMFPPKQSISDVVVEAEGGGIEMGNMTNFATMSKKNKIYALESEIADEEYYMSNTSQPHKMRNRRKYINSLKKDLAELLNKPTP